MFDKKECRKRLSHLTEIIYNEKTFIYCTITLNQKIEQLY